MNVLLNKNDKPILKVKKTRAFRDHWGILFENEMNRYCLIKSATFTDDRVKCEYVGHMIVTDDANLISGKGIPEQTNVAGPFVKLSAQSKDEIYGSIVLEVESFLGQSYKMTTSEIRFVNLDIKNPNRIWLEFLKVEKIKRKKINKSSSDTI